MDLMTRNYKICRKKFYIYILGDIPLFINRDRDDVFGSYKKKF